MNDEKVIEYPQQDKEQQNLHYQTSKPQHVIQQTGVAQQNNEKNDELAAGCLGGCLGFWFPPMIGITPLFCFPEARPREIGIILFTAGLGGLSWAIFFFVRNSM
jgi:hypothetical protein